MISCRNLSKSFGDHKVLDRISFDVPEGIIVGLLGPSGAGKTTLIKILTGQLVFDEGKVSVMGKAVADLTGTDRNKFGIMMDNFGLYERFTCKENLQVFADVYHISPSKVTEALRSVGLEDAAKTKASDLSKGMRARLLLARALMHDPKIIFLDEPTSGLDPKSMRGIHKIILEKKNAGCTIFLTTHNMEEATVLCDEVALLNDGKIVDRGNPSDICRRYNHQKAISIHLKTGEDIRLPDGIEYADEISYLLRQGKVETIHSSEPTLETVFIELTGRKLENDTEARYA